jgi:hypothetical protein
MTATAITTADAVLELLEREACAINMTGLVQLLADHTEPEIKRLTNDLYMKGKIQRVQVVAPHGRYYAFYALSVRTARGQAGRAQLEQLAETGPAPAPLPETLSTEQALDVLERAGWIPEPEIVEPVDAAAPIQIERRVADRRRLTVLEVVKRWRLGYQLGRVVEVIAGSRKGGLTRDDAALAIKMLREHVREGE